MCLLLRLELQFSLEGGLELAALFFLVLTSRKETGEGGEAEGILIGHLVFFCGREDEV